jgi:hypothetical protein
MVKIDRAFVCIGVAPAARHIFSILHFFNIKTLFTKENKNIKLNDAYAYSSSSSSLPIMTSSGTGHNQLEAAEHTPVPPAVVDGAAHVGGGG